MPGQCRRIRQKDRHRASMKGFLQSGLGSASRSLLSHRFLRLVERPAAWPGGPFPRKLRGEDLSGTGAWDPAIPPACLDPARSQALQCGSRFPWLHWPEGPVLWPPAQPSPGPGSRGHHLSHPRALASPKAHLFPPVSNRANSRSYLPAAL